MTGVIPVLFALLLFADARISISGNGWTADADASSATLAIRHEKLGAVLGNVRLGIRTETGIAALNGWSVGRNASTQLTVRTEEPRTNWLFDFAPNRIQIACTSARGVVLAAAPAPKDRIVVRLLDPAGAPVDWVGTDEVVGTYGGTETHNRSFLPRRNPDVMYFALGQVSGGQFHSLFDRKSGVAIDFPEDTSLARNADDRDTLEVTIPVAGNAVVKLLPDYFTATLGVPFYQPFDDSHFSRAPVVWSSWTSYYADVTEQDIVRNADWFADHLKPYGFEYVQLDDGYDRGPEGEHYWIEKWDTRKFPHGPQWLAAYIKSKGLRPGLWIVPNAYAGAVEQQPNWYLRDKHGRVVLDYHTPALDSSNPEVLAFLKKMFATLDDWGFEYYKFDGEHALPKYAPPVDRTHLFNSAVDPIEAYRNRLKAIRETLGPDRFVEGCPAGTPLNGIGYFDSYFNGHDLYNNWQGMHPLFSSINANAFLNHLAVYVMPGEGVELGPPMTIAEVQTTRHPSVLATARTREDPLRGFGVTLAEARTLVTYLSLTGVVYPLASVMPELPEERVRLLEMTLPPMPILPMDLFSRGTDMQWDRFKFTDADSYIHNYPEILDLKVNAASGVYDVVAVTNWRSRPLRRRIGVADKLGLDPAVPYVVFDYWNQSYAGAFKDAIDVEVAPHDTRVLLIHPAASQPKLMALSRHITGAYSISSLVWDAAGRRLRGESETIPGKPYTMWFYVPDGMASSGVKASAAGVEVPAGITQTGNVATVRFDGQTAPIVWEVNFR